MNKISRAVLGAALLAVCGLAAANTIDTTVDAKANSISGGTGADSFDLIAASTFSVTASGLWQNDPDTAVYQSGPDGLSNLTFTLAGSTFDIGALVGQIGNGSYFLVGSGVSDMSTGAGGQLKLFYWDSDAFNNSGAIVAEVTAVPEPGNIALMGLALGAFALTRRRKA